eukprot:Ihof_evm3s173 gene=Ihof_evmTU3s173
MVTGKGTMPSNDNPTGPRTVTGIQHALSFPEAESSYARLFDTHIDLLKDSFPCIMCEYNGKDKQQVLGHLLESHHIVIADVDNLVALHAYLSHWKHRLLTLTIKDVAVTMATAPTTDSPGGEFYMLSPAVDEDEILRHRLRKDTLATLLEYQQMERADMHNNTRRCLFCKTIPMGNRKDYLNHMLQAHGLSIGLPDNIVCLDVFLELLSNKLRQLQCLHCEKTFKTKDVLRAHMRKKKHFKLNSHNKDYDKFYMVNYLEEGKGWEALQKEKDTIDSGDETGANQWDEWQEESSDENVTVCLFCSHLEASPEDIFPHMVTCHGFDFKAIRRDKKLDFYQCIKMLNYLRRQTYQRRCYVCDQSFPLDGELLAHAQANAHFDVSGQPDIWNMT